jgi:hypothetical protein
VIDYRERGWAPLTKKINPQSSWIGGEGAGGVEVEL